ncbi:MAG: hypothetical protein IT243_06190 [Bacteroidia bacterium]|nr:hypothetical protein [Bacteroidia bacterium]
MISLAASAQTPFERHYGSSYGSGDGISSEFVTCASVDPANYTYAAVHAIRDVNVTPPSFTIRGARIKSDGTMLTGSFDYIKESTATYDIFPLKIITINNNTEYMIIGYVMDLDTPALPHPFVIRTDAALAAFEFKVFTDHPGFFTDVDQLSGGDFLFCGAMTNTLHINANYRLGWMLRTDNAYTKQWMRYTHSYEHSVSLSRKDFDIVHDLILIDDDSAIVCGNITEQIDICDATPGLDSSSNIAFIAKVNLSDGSFAWYKSIIKLANASRLAMNNTGTIIAMAVNFETSFATSGVSFWDRAGNYLFGNIFEVPYSYTCNLTVSDTVYNNVNINFHNNINIQNIYFNSDGNLFISGKFAHVFAQGNNLYDHFDMPFNTIDSNISSGAPTIGNFNIYKSAEKFQGFSNILSYKYWSNVTTKCPYLYPQIYSASNTLPCLSGCGTDEYVTVTLDEAIDANTNQVGLDKVWIFSNDNNPCGYINIGSYNLDLPIFPVSLVMHNDNILVTPGIGNFNYINSNPSNYIHNCEQ